MRERRKHERFVFAEPQPGHAAGQHVLVSEIGIEGFTILHDAPLPVAKRVQVEVDARLLEGEVATCKFSGPGASSRYRSGITIRNSSEATRVLVRTWLTELITEELRRTRHVARFSAAALSA